MTTATWYTLRGTGDPIDGDPVEFDQVEDRFWTIENSLRDLGGDFRELATTGSGFSGDAADAFRSKVSEINTALNDVPDICRSLQQIFRDHAAALRALQKEADDALARAQTQWNAVQNAGADKDKAQAELRYIQRQIDFLDAQGDAADPVDRSYWETEQSAAIDWERSANSSKTNAQNLLNDELAKWNTLHQGEDDLDQQTADKLRNLELWSLGDPSLLEQVTSLLADIGQAFKDLAKFLVSPEFLLALYNVLDVILTVLGVITLIFSFVPGVNAVLATLVAVLAVVKLVVGIIIYVRVPGELSFGDILIDFGSALLAIVGASAAIKMTNVKGLMGAGMSRSTAHNLVVGSNKLNKIGATHLFGRQYTAAEFLRSSQYARAMSAATWTDRALLGRDLYKRVAPIYPTVQSLVTMPQAMPVLTTTSQNALRIKLAPTGW